MFFFVDQQKLENPLYSLWYNYKKVSTSMKNSLSQRCGCRRAWFKMFEKCTTKPLTCRDRVSETSIERRMRHSNPALPSSTIRRELKASSNVSSDQTSGDHCGSTSVFAYSRVNASEKKQNLTISTLSSNTTRSSASVKTTADLDVSPEDGAIDGSVEVRGGTPQAQVHSVADRVRELPCGFIARLHAQQLSPQTHSAPVGENGW